LEKKTWKYFQGGWFKTGDIGEWKEDGTLAIIDRKKNLVKIANGEYIPLEKLESRYSRSQLIDHICIFPDKKSSFLIAVVSPNKSCLKKLQEKSESTSQQEGLKKEILNSLNSIAKESSLSNNERIGDIIISSEEWTQENGDLTAAHKIRRRNIAEKYKDQLESLSATPQHS